MTWTLISITLFLLGSILIISENVTYKLYNHKDKKIFWKYQVQIDKEMHDPRMTNEQTDWDYIAKLRRACDKEQHELRESKLYKLHDFLDTDEVDSVKYLSVILGAIGLFICGLIILITHTGVDAQIRSNQIEYESLCDRLEIVNSDYEDISKSDVIKDVADWNDRVNRALYWSQNTWTSWFYSQREVSELKFIEYGGIK